MLQGFWKALNEHDEAVQVFGQLLTLCDEFSVTLDYNTPVSGGEWVVTVAHFADRTTFRFPRLGFNARDAYNQLSQRLQKAERSWKSIAEKEQKKLLKAEEESVESSEVMTPAVEAGLSKDTGTNSVDTTSSESESAEGESVSADGQTDLKTGAPAAEDGTTDGGDKSSNDKSAAKRKGGKA